MPANSRSQSHSLPAHILPFILSYYFLCRGVLTTHPNRIALCSYDQACLRTVQEDLWWERHLHPPSLRLCPPHSLWLATGCFRLQPSKLRHIPTRTRLRLEEDREIPRSHSSMFSTGSGRVSHAIQSRVTETLDHTGAPCCSRVGLKWSEAEG